MNELYIIQNGIFPNWQWYCGQQEMEGKERAVFSDIPGGIIRFHSEEEAREAFNQKIQGKPLAFCKQPSKKMAIRKWSDFVDEYM